MGRTATADYFIGVSSNAGFITTNSVPDATLSQLYSTTILQSGMPNPVFSNPGGGMPPGLTLSAGGVISGTPNTAGNYVFLVRLQDSGAGANNTRQYTINVSTAPSLTFSVPSPNEATVNISSLIGINASGGRAPYSLSISAGTLPDGLYLENFGSALGISGTPMISGNQTFTVLLTDCDGRTASAAYTINVRQNVRITTLNADFPVATISVPYSIALGATLGLAPYTFTLASGALPAGVTMTPTGVISGTPSSGTTANFSILVTDAAGRTTELSYFISPASGFSITNTVPMPSGGVLNSYSVSVLTGLEATNTRIVAGDLPPLLYVNPATGGIIGVPTVPGVYSFTIEANDGNGRTATQAQQITILGGLSFTPVTVPNGVLSSPYSVTFVPFNTYGAVAWSIVGGGLPPGVTLDPATGVLSGTPNATGPFSFTVQAIDAAFVPVTQNYTMQVLNFLTINPATVPNGTVGANYSQVLTATGSSGATSWAVTAGALPGGLTLGPANGILSGIPTTGGTFNFTVTATDSFSQTGSRAYTLTVLNTLSITPTSLPNGTINTAYSQQLTATGGTGAIGWTVTAGALPAGVTLAPATGILSGTPTASGTFNFTVTATDSLTQTGSRAYTLTVANTLTITPATLPNGTINTAYSQQLTATGGTGAIGWAVTAGALPTGVTLAPSTGILAGTPTAAGAFNFTVTATDSLSQTGSQAYSLTVNGVLAITPASLPNGTINSAYSQQLTATGGTGAIGWAITAGALPTGVTLAPATGILSGTPTASGTFNITVTATDSLTQIGSQAYTLTVLNTLSITPTSLPNGTLNAAYSQQLTATGGTGAVGWAVTAGALPTGVALAPATGILAGTPTASGTFNFTVTATDSLNQTGTRAYSLTVNGVLAIAPTSLSNGTINTAYSQQLTATGGTGAIGWTVTAGTLPTGVTLAPSTGILSGTPTVSGTFNFTVTATDSLTQTGSQGYTLTVLNTLAITPATLPSGTINTPYTQQLTATGGTGAIGWAVTTGALPTGLTLGPTSGAITGTPTASGTFNFTVTATDSLTQTGSRAYSLTVNGVLAITPTSLPNGAINTAYTQQLTATGGTGAIGWAVTTGALPTGLTLGPTSGAITGTPTASGTFNFTVTATDSLTQTGTRAYSLTVNGVLAITPTSISNGAINTPYTQQLTASGGTGAIGWSVTAGALPTGLTLGPTSGAITGTPTASGTFNLTVTATDSLTQTGSQGYTLTIAGTLAITPAALPNGTINTVYNQTLIATGGSGAIGWAVTAGALPTGLTLNPQTGALTGTPTAFGTFPFTVTATDSLTQTGTRAYSLVILNVLTIGPASLPNGTINTVYNQTLIATPTTTGAAWAVTAGALPTGLTLNAQTGQLTGTTTTPGSFPFTVTATDSQSQTGSKDYTLLIAGTLTVNPASIPSGTINTAYTQQLTAISVTGGPVAATWAVTAGALPGGLTLNPTTGALTGTPTVAGTFPFTVTATDSQSQTGTRAYSLVILNVLTIAPSTLPNGTAGTVYNQTLTATPASTSITWAVTSGTLPTGLTLNAQTGQLTGTPTAPGQYTFTATATDLLSQTGSRAYTVTILAVLSVTPASVPVVYTGVPYTQAFAATGGTGAITWSIGSTPLPPGLTLNAGTGIVSGTTSATTGVYTVTIQATDTLTQSGSRTYDFLVRPPVTITPPTLPDATQGTAYSQSLTATGALGIALFQLTAGALPAGLTLANNGVISGTPTTVGTATFDVTVATPQQQVATRTLTLTVLDPLAISTAALPDATELEAYTTALTATGGGASGLSWTLLTGALPPGVALATTGVLSGTPTQHGTYPFTVQLVNAAGTRVTKALSLLVVQALSITTLSLGETVQGRSYTTTLTALGGRAPFTWSLVNSTLPTGLQLNPSTGQITGTTSVTEGPYPQNVTVTDSRGRVARRTLPFAVAVPPPPSLNISPTAIPNGRVNQPYSAGFSATGGTPGYSFAIVQGAPPTGLSLNAGTLSGTPTQEGTFRFTVNATDSQGRVAGNQYTVVIEPALVPLVVTPSSIAPTTQVGQPLTLQFGATGGKAPYTFAITGNTPPSTSSNSSGVLSGTPSQGGTFSFTVQVTDSLGDKASRGYSLSVTGNLVITTQPPLAEGTTGKPYSLSFGATGGRQPYTWSVSGTTPPGLAFNNGDLSGTPTTAGTFNFSVTVQDPQQLTATAAFSITIWEPVTITNTPADTPLLTGQPFNFTYSTRGGKPPVTLALSGGALPAGLTFANGVITGTPTGAGNFAFTVQATDGLGNTTQQSSALRVVAPLTVTTTALPSGTVGTAYSAAVAATGGVAPLGTWSLSQGALPAGLSLAPDGAITGTPTAAGTSTFTVRITDAANTAATRQLSIAIQLPPVPGLVLPGLPQFLTPGTQTNITIQLAQPFPVPVTGTLTLIFEPNAINNADDPSVQFSSGGRTVTFVIPPGQTIGTFPVTPLRLLSGTVAGTIRIRITTSPESATPVPDAIVPITRSAPVITAGTAQLSATSFTLLIDGFSNTREIVSATFRLTPAPGSSLATTDVPVNVAATFAAYYQSPASIPFGGQFRLTQPFNVNGPLTDIDSVVVTVTNSVGTSQPFTIRLR